MEVLDIRNTFMEVLDKDLKHLPLLIRLPQEKVSHRLDR